MPAGNVTNVSARLAECLADAGEIRFDRRGGAADTRFVEPVRSYVICCVQRTGSWLLAHTLADTGYAGRPSDYFDEAEREHRAREWGLPPGDLGPYVRAMWDHATTPNGVLGSKLMFNDFDWLRSSLRPPAGTDAGLEFMRTTFPHPQFVWLRRADKVRQGISWWRADVTNQWGLRPGRRPGSRRPTWSRWCSSSGSRSGVKMAGGSGSHQPGSSPAKSSTKTSSRDRLAAANAVLEFLRLPQLEAGDLPPVRYRKQADSLTDRYVDLVRSAMNSQADPGRPPSRPELTCARPGLGLGPLASQTIKGKPPWDNN